MSIMWIIGGVYFWVYRERHWPWGENAPAPQLKDNPMLEKAKAFTSKLKEQGAKEWAATEE